MGRARGEVFELTLRADPDPSWPAIIRLRSALKRFKRVYKLTCVKVSEVKPVKGARKSKSPRRNDG